MALSLNAKLPPLAFHPSTRIRDPEAEHLYAMCLTPSGLLLTGGSSGTIHIYHLKKGNLLQAIATGSVVTSIRWTLIDRRFETLWVGLEDGIVSLYLRKLSWMDSMPIRLFRLGFIPFSLAVQSSIQSPVEDMATRQGEVIVTGGKSITLFKISIKSTFFMKHPSVSLQSVPVLLYPFQDDSYPTSKRANTVNVSSDSDITVITFVDSSPLVANGVIAVYQRNGFDFYKAVQINRRIGASALSSDSRFFAITNLADGIDIFTLPDLNLHASIAQKIAAKDNEVISLEFIDDSFIAVGGAGGITVYSIESLRMVGCLQEQSPSSLYRCIAVSSQHQVVAGGSVNGNIAVWRWKALANDVSTVSSNFRLPSQTALCSALIFMMAAYIPILYLVVLHTKD